MGLDIYHFKAIHDYNENSDFIYACELPDYAITELGFDSFIKKVMKHGLFDRVALFKSHEDKSLVQQSLQKRQEPSDSFDLFLVGPIENHDETLLDYEIKHELEPNTRQIFEDDIQIGDQTIEFKTIMYEYNKECELIYHKDVAYQRKGMSSPFYEYYDCETPYYVELNEIKKLKDFQDFDSPLHIPNNIEDNFINNYEVGKSFYLLSW